MKFKSKSLLLLIILLAFFLRFNQVDQIPPSLSWDEAAVGYNAYTIANWGKDEWGYSFPMFFRSFGDDKNPMHVYLTAVSVKILGLTEMSTRLPMVILGTANVLLLFLLASRLFSNNIVGLISAFILAISPYNIQFSRFNHEANVALLFFMLGLWLFLKSVDRQKWLLPLAMLNFGLSLLSYHSAKIVVPIVVIILGVIFFKKLWQMKKQLIAGAAVIMLFGLIFITNPELLGTSRAKQLSISQTDIQKTTLYKKTNSKFLGQVDLVWQKYLAYFDLKYLFETGDAIARHSSQGVGEFYKIDAIFLLLGLVALLLKRSKTTIIILVWALIAPIPAAMAGEKTASGHAARAMFMMGSWHLIIAYGLFFLLNIFKKIPLKVMLVIVWLGILGWEFKAYILDYYQNYPRQYAIEWQYGMKQAVEYTKDHNGYKRVYMTRERFQPYIFFLYYLKTPLPEYLKFVEVNTGEYKPSNIVAVFDKYQFDYWDPIESMPYPGILYIVTPSQYDGLRYKDVFDVKKRVKYPNGSDAFFLVSYP